MLTDLDIGVDGGERFDMLLVSDILVTLPAVVGSERGEEGREKMRGRRIFQSGSVSDLHPAVS